MNLAIFWCPTTHFASPQMGIDGETLLNERVTEVLGAKIDGSIVLGHFKPAGRIEWDYDMSVCRSCCQEECCQPYAYTSIPCEILDWYILVKVAAWLGILMLEYHLEGKWAEYLNCYATTTTRKFTRNQSRISVMVMKLLT